MSTQQQCVVLNIPDWLKERNTLLHYWVARHEKLNWRVEKKKGSGLSEVSGDQFISMCEIKKKHVGSRYLYSWGWMRRSRRRWVLNLRLPVVTLASPFLLWSNLTGHTQKVDKVSIWSTIQQSWSHLSRPSWPLGVATVQLQPPREAHPCARLCGSPTPLEGPVPRLVPALLRFQQAVAALL